MFCLRHQVSCHPHYSSIFFSCLPICTLLVLHFHPCHLGLLPHSPSHVHVCTAFCAVHNLQCSPQHLSRTRRGSFLCGGHHYSPKFSASPIQLLLIWALATP